MKNRSRESKEREMARSKPKNIGKKQTDFVERERERKTELCL